jgi:hypothetical protein
VSEVKRNCGRVIDRGKEAWSINHESMDKNRIEGAAEQGERAKNREALVVKAKRRRCGDCVVKECGPYLGTPCLTPERVAALPWQGLSRGHSSWR